MRDHHRELKANIAEPAPDGRRFAVVFRVFDDGIGFRYELPEQPGLGAFEITEELTEFRMADDARAWWIPADGPHRYEYLYSASPVSRLGTVHTPLTMETRTGLHVVIHEAHLENYAAMNLTGSLNRTQRASLAPWARLTRYRRFVFARHHLLHRQSARRRRC